MNYCKTINYNFFFYLGIKSLITVWNNEDGLLMIMNEMKKN